MIRGIGPAYAKKLLRAFGEKVFEVIETQADRLQEVTGIGPVRAGRICAECAGNQHPNPEFDAQPVGRSIVVPDDALIGGSFWLFCHFRSRLKPQRLSPQAYVFWGAL